MIQKALYTECASHIKHFLKEELNGTSDSVDAHEIGIHSVSIIAKLVQFTHVELNLLEKM